MIDRFARTAAACAVWALSAACNPSPAASPTSTSGDRTAGPTTNVPTSPDPLLQAIAARLPADWSGTGVLEPRDDVPAGAPAWAAVVADVVDEADGRFLRATGLANHITNQTLARSTADARARATLATWIGTERLVGTEVREHWGIPSGPTLALVRVRVPAQWRPGDPLPDQPTTTPETAGADQDSRRMQ